MAVETLLKRGQVWMVCLDPTVGAEIKKTRPGLVISNDINNRLAETVTVIPLTSKTGRVFPFEVFLPRNNSGLPKDSKAKCDQIRTVDKKRLVRIMGKISDGKLKEIEQAILIHLGMY
jgi:mRNA interferase MazF